MTSFTFNLLKKVNISRNIVRNIQVWSSDNVIRSPFEDVVIPDCTVVEYMWSNVEKWATKTAVVCGVTNRGYTYEQIYKKSRKLGANLRKKMKVRDGDIIGIMASNMPEYPIVTFGILAAGGVVTTFNPVYTAYEIKRQMELSDIKAMIVNEDSVQVVKEALQLAKKEIPVITINIDRPIPTNTISYKELVEDNNVDLSILREVKRTSDDISFLPYSSGTTGMPKGVELTNRNIVANCEQQNTDVRQYRFTTENHQDVTLALLPLFHMYGLSIIMVHKMASGLKVVTLPNFQPDTFLNSLINYQINLLYLAPPMVLFLGSHPQVTKKHFAHTNVVCSGAAPLPTVDIENIFRKSGRTIRMTQGYGMTEASPLVTLTPREAPETTNYESVGCVIPNMRAKIVDKEMKALGPGQVGELLIQGPNIMRGYKNNPEENKAVLLDGGWYRSGDAGKIDESGLFYITERLKELIKVKGYQVPPAELENVLREYTNVHDVAVIGIPDPVTGERPKAFIVPKPGTKIDVQDLKEFLSKRVAPYKKINEIVFVENIPRNASGKILRRMLK